MNEKRKDKEQNIIREIILSKIVVVVGLLGIHAAAYSAIRNSEDYRLTIVFLLDLIIMICLFSGKYVIRRRDSKIVKYINIGISIVVPIVLFLFVELAVGDISLLSFKYILLNLMLYTVVYLFFVLLFRKQRIAVLIYTILIMILTLVYYFVLEFRGKPFMLLDIFAIATATSVANSYVYEISISLLVNFQCIILFLVVQFQFMGLEWKTSTKSRKNRNILMGLLIIVTVCVVSQSISGKIKWDYVDMWDIEGSYKSKGLVYSLFCELQYIKANKPEGYSVEAVEKITENVNKKTWDTTSPENLIVIMNESLADLEVIGEIKTDQEIIPYIKNITENTIKGWLQVPVFGGGTADSEYEVLTGNVKTFHPNGTTAYQLYTHDLEYGLASKLKKQGYYTIAMHPFNAINWNRVNVYNNMGFDEFISIENWEDPIEKVLWTASDETAYKKVIKKIHEKKKDDKQFIFLVTMQNHGGYDRESYNYHPTVSLAYGDVQYPQTETYLSAIKESDSAFEKLIEYFSNVEERTMIVMFGDHQPAVENAFYEELFGKALGDLELEEKQLMYRTPYLIWTNYESASLVEQNMSSNFLGSYILQVAGLELTPYDQFLLNMKDVIPIIGQGGVYDKDGKWYAFEELPELYWQLMNEYNILEYNNVFDYKNRVSSVFDLEQ